MSALLDILREFGLPIAFLFFALVAVCVIWKELRKKDRAYMEVTKELHTSLDERSKQFADTIMNFISLFGKGGNRDGS